ncbi:helix-turn-helix domain-containing protein [Lacticaseibacillus rhamnosus]|uniref:helix-turn-helix domain-containing protein n=1 Tax=Lacticaseibacillus rhamnosus TaxID=47715 RepID=UPI00237F140D|nr:helix-turn-helix domain-containing protein [Lacticaseibacillus rhamnosus]MDE3295710.1 helix-turn-helix domain-containing protein [Lacticaseibacillus rhamnosus]
MAISVAMNLPDDFEESIKRDMYATALEAFKATAKKHPFAEYMQRKDAAEYLGVSSSTLDKLTKQGLPTIIIDGLKLYRKASLDQWLLKHQI